MSVRSPHVAMVAGETSGDLLAGLLLDGLRAKWPEVQSHGIGGPQMQQRGFDAWWQSERLAVHGYSFELIQKLLGILKIRNHLRDRLLADKPDVFIGVDAPDFNLGLEGKLRAVGIKTVHFVCPSIWAWRADRIDTIRASADHVLCIFPFEPELLAKHGIAATYVGHPLARVIPMVPDKAGARAQLGLRVDDEVLAILPGSRSAEVAYIAKPFFLAAKRLLARRPGLKLVVPAVPKQREKIESIARECGMEGQLHIVTGQSHTVMAACDCTLIASGTATLEAALYKLPMVISYHMHPISWRLMKRKQLQPWVGLPNILCRDFVVPELLQHEATPDTLAAAVERWLDARKNNSPMIQALEERFTALHESLLRDTPKLAADAIEKVLFPVAD
ncbi:lipid-A-disaccharide synthase [Diaphorobacter sp.]|uniref:lipid-A-disaccharide synthase n=1 Tax=Diaphorobacter sp. TaxID=1934310 RepID=UPI0028B14D00|nr:lipid-A-disaccharide synthase [Diaphorobacter sp.]